MWRGIKKKKKPFVSATFILAIVGESTGSEAAFTRIPPKVVLAAHQKQDQPHHYTPGDFLVLQFACM